MSIRFETEQDRINEISTIEKFIASVDPELRYKKLMPNELDFVLYKGEDLKAFVEVKNFNAKFRKYPTEIVSEIKYKKMLTFSLLAPTYFMANYSCGTIAWIEVNDIVGERQWFKRNDIRDGSANDAENVIMVDKSLMKKIKT